MKKGGSLEIRKLFVTAVLTTMVGVLVSSLHGMAQDVIRLKTHTKEIDKRVDENHTRAMKIFTELRTIRRQINENHKEVLNHLLDERRK